MACFACSASQSRSRRTIEQNKELATYKVKFRFIDNELLEFRQRFNSSANARGLIDRPAFMESMGVLGLDSQSPLSNRIFNIMDRNKDGFIRLTEYLEYFDILIYGSQEEKDELTFRMIDVKGKGYFEFEEFSDMIMSMLQTWSNITGHNYNVYSNKKLAHFLEAVFSKFDINNERRVSLDAFKVAVSKEPELLEIFDYFNEGIIDAVQPPNEFDRHQNELVQDLEDLYLKLEGLKALTKPKKKEIPHELPKDQPQQAPQFPIESPKAMMINSMEGRRSSIFQTLNTKIRKTALFEHLTEEAGGQGEIIDGVCIRRPRSAMHKVDDLLVVDSAHTLRKSDELCNTPSKAKINAGRHSYGADGYTGIRNARTMPYELTTESALSSCRPALGLENKRIRSPDELVSSHNNPPDSAEKVRPDSLASLMDSSREPGHSHDQGRALQFGRGEFKKIESKNDAQGFKSPKSDKAQAVTFSDPSPGRTIKRRITEEEEKEDDIIQLDDLLPIVEKVNTDENAPEIKISSIHSLHHLPFKIQPKVLEQEDLDPLTAQPNANVNLGIVPRLPPSFLDEIQMTDSLTMAKAMEEATKEAREGNMTTSNKVSVPPMRISLNGERFFQKKTSLGENDEERLGLLQMQIDVIAAETRRIIEELHLKRKQNNHKQENNSDEEKQIEMLKEATAKKVPRNSNPKKSTKKGKGNFVSFGHQNWNIVVNMMLGIQKAVKSTVERPEPLSFKDFKLKYIFELLPQRTNEMKDTFKICTFFDYAPSVFLEIRRFFGIKNEDYLKSIGPESMLNGLIKGNLSTLAELTSSGKSGSFFYYSADGKYTLKTISRDEFHFLRRILNNYYNHMVTNPNSLVIKFFGLHKMRFMKGPQRKAKLYFIIMANVFHTSREIHIRYDLKGSRVGRRTKESDLSIARKDLDMVDSKEKIVLTKDVAETFTSVIEKDSKFFEENGIIDYSLLLGVHQLEHDEMSTKDISHKKPVEFRTQSRDGVLSGDGTKIYYFGIIDILTQFNAKKRAEYMIKRVAYGKWISAVPPPQYASRFRDFILKLVETA